jgi:hypothetical protein
MSGVPGEPEKFSIDEMMNRLKESASENPEDGELVTRSDGSQAIRVRKRKRRSTQPHKEQMVRSRRVRIYQVSAALLLLFVAGLAVSGALVYANSRPYRENLLRMISESTGATAELYQFRMNPRAANANHLNLNWPPGQLLESLTTQGIAAEVSPSSFLGKSFTGEEITGAETILTLQIPKLQSAQPATTSAPLNSRIAFNRYRTSAFNLTLGPPEKPLIRLYKSEASLSSSSSAGLPQVRLYRGDLAINGLPNFRVNRALLEFRSQEIDLIGLRLLHPTDDRGALEFSGTFSPSMPDQLANLSVKLDSFLLDGITGPQLGRLISGRIDSISITKSNFFSFQPTETSTPILDIAFGVAPTSSIQLQAFPFLFTISQLLEEDEWFEKPVFESDATGIIHREMGILSFRNLNFVSKGRITIQGNLSMAVDQSLSGTFQVGLAENMIPKASPLRSMVGPTKDGFRWIELKIGGSATSPTDNFRTLFDEAGAAKTPDSSETETTGSSFEELTRPK